MALRACVQHHPFDEGKPSLLLETDDSAFCQLNSWYVTTADF